MVVSVANMYLNHPLSVFAVARIALVKPEKARGVEDVLLRAAQMGQIVEKVRQLCQRKKREGKNV